MFIIQRSEAYFRAASSLVFIIFLCLGVPSQTESQIQFEEVTYSAGVSFSGDGWGASWGDFNGDGKPDIWVSDCTPHTRYFLLNNGDGTFRDASELIIGAAADTHGASWADFDNDGDQDLIQLVGGGNGVGTGSNQLFVNTGNLLEDLAGEYGLDYPLGRGRTPLWLDWNRDGYLDTFLANDKRPDGLAPSALFTHGTGFFVHDNSLTGITTVHHNLYAQLTHLGTEHTPILMIHTHVYPDRVYELTMLPFEDISENLGFPNVFGVNDTVIADFNGDLANDIYLAMINGHCHSEVQHGSTTIRAAIQTEGLEKGFHFRTQGIVSFNVPQPGTKSFREGNTVIPLKIDDIYIGQDGHHPGRFFFTITPADAIGLFPHSPGDLGVFIEYDPQATLWQVYISGFPQTNLIVDSQTPILDLETIGFTSCNGATEDRLLVFRSKVFQDMTVPSGLDVPSACGSVVAADFDNDMDIDLYLVCRSLATNLPNRLYENLGNATFKMVSSGGGAEGSTIGRGDSAIIADYDEDGFVDLFVTNGFGAPPFDKGPSQLFRNLGNDNYWIEIDLEGDLSNRDGIGTRLLVTAGGITQVREQTGGMHARSQNHQRVHFGLAENTRIDKLTVLWPSGARHDISNIPANQIIRVVEPSYPSARGKPDFTPGYTSGVFLWKESFDGPYHLRASGNGPLAVFEINILADRPFTSVEPVRLENNDQLFWIDNHLSFTARITTGQDGIDFVLPPATDALISVAVNGISNPRQLHVGGLGLPITPTGWVIKVDQLPELPDFKPGTDLGLFIGLGAFSDEIRARWNGDGYGHTAALKIVSSNVLLDVEPVSFESCCGDSLSTASRSLSATGRMSSWWDGLNIQVPSDSAIGISYSQDGFFQPHRVNGKTRNLGQANAFALPMADVFGTPGYDPSEDKGLFIWRSENGVWHLRCTAGGGSGRYQGAIVSSQPVLSVESVWLETNDVLELSVDRMRIDFDLRVWNQALDGIDIETAEGAKVFLDLNDNTANAAKLVQLGGDRWPLDRLPAVLAQ